MTEGAYAVHGDLVLAPTTATSGGTVVRGLDQSRPLQLVMPHGMATERFGGRLDAVRSYRRPFAEPMHLVIPAASGSATTLKLLIASHTADGSTIQSSGGDALGAARGGRSWQAVIRPRDTSEPYIFIPRLQLFEDSSALLNRNPVNYAVIDEGLLVMLCAGPEDSDAPAVIYGDASTIDAAIAAASGEDMAYISKIVTLAELNAIGASQAGAVAMDTALPAGAIPIGFTCRNRGSNITSSGGTISGLTALVVASGQTTEAVNANAVTDLHTASQRGGRALDITSNTATTAPWPNTAWTPRVYFQTGGSGVTFANLIGGADGIEVFIFYQPVSLPTP